jgi:hypothetical protein
MDGMSCDWKRVTAADVRPGERIRTADGTELEVTRIEERFLGRDEMIAFIEDTPDRWFKRPVTADAPVDLLISD